MPPLHHAVEVGDIKKVQGLLRRGAAIDARDDYNRTPLHLAASNGDHAIAHILIAAGADLNADGGPFYDTALQAAAATGVKRVVELLIEKGAHVNAFGGQLGSALHAATAHGHEDVVAVLIKKGADLNARGYYRTALHTAAKDGNVEIATLLIENGANVNVEDAYHGTPICDAAATGNRETVEILLRSGADVGARSGQIGSALQAAVARGNLEILELLLSNEALGKDPSSDLSLLRAAAASKTPEVMRTLLSANTARFLEEVDRSGQTLLHVAVASRNLQMLEVVFPVFKSWSPSIDQRDIDGRTPLHLAVEAEAVDLVRWLLERGAQADVQDYGDATPFRIASQLENFEILRLLYPKITRDHTLLSASKWRSISGHRPDQIILMVNDKLSTIKMISKEDLNAYLLERGYSLAPGIEKVVAKERSMAMDESEKRIFLLADDSFMGSISTYGVHCRWWRQARSDFLGQPGWIAQASEVPSAVTISQVQRDKCFLECRVELPVLPTSDQRRFPKDLAKSLEPLKKKHAIVWTMVKCDREPEQSPPSRPPSYQNLLDSKRSIRSLLKATTFFSTLEYAAVPDAATDLFAPMVQQVHEEWKVIYRAAEEHLDIMRTRVLQSNGTRLKLINDLLIDARLWDQLNKLLEDQISTLQTLETRYKSSSWIVLHEAEENKTQHAIEDFGTRIFQLSKQVHANLRKLRSASQELIQLEFNLTSIREAQKSTSINRSLKRLSWITFIFLPLTFVTGLFGMNINLINNGPPWWTSLLFATGIMTLTVIAWVLLKRNEDLEDSIKENPRWLTKSKTHRNEEDPSPHGDQQRSWIRRTFQSEKAWEEERGLDVYYSGKEKVE